MEFSTARNGERTCCENGFQLHSLYNPTKEAERFCENIECNFNPHYLLVTEPALSYCSSFLRKKFSGAILCCVRFSMDFSSTDECWDKVFHASGEDGKKNTRLEEEIFSFMGDEGISACLFLSWKPSEKAFKELHEFTWNEIKSAVLKSRAVLATRTFFSKRWTRNAIRFSLFTEKTARIQKGTADIVVCASGPSLMQNIPFLKKNRDKFFLIAVSSAAAPLVHYGIEPDLCISTDGGYWAKLHLAPLCALKNIPLALPGEASCFASILCNSAVVPLFYGDGCSEEILKGSGYQGLSAVRNGSVSGTAALLALSLTEGNVFYCGLDLAYTKGFAHVQPNELEKRNAAAENRINTAETRIAACEINAASIAIYRNWFSSFDFQGRIYRLSDHFYYSSRLGKIEDVSWDFFEKRNSASGKKMPEIIKSESHFSREKRMNLLRDIIITNMSNPEWIKNALPSETVALERCRTPEETEEQRKKIQEKMKIFFCDIMGALGKGTAI
ncbi:6-hydroxymethylpterin diphosphokinase MptE-like protein [Treponema sp.]|uniref:6-hydroxymethylpterin diphosphokinase MptE-like protein n=1 Tax=Treponema sp. TaxID=166 RepID=UPI003F0C644D